MNLSVTTHIDGMPDDFSGIPQYEDEMTIALYQRAGPERAQLEFNFFVNKPDGAT